MDQARTHHSYWHHLFGINLPSFLSRNEKSQPNQQPGSQNESPCIVIICHHLLQMKSAVLPMHQPGQARVDLGRVHTKGFTCTTSVSCWAKPLKQTIQCLDRGFHGGHWQNEGYDSILFNPGDGGQASISSFSLSRFFNYVKYVKYVKHVKYGLRMSCLWVNYSDLTVTLLESRVVKGIISKWPSFRVPRCMSRYVKYVT